jgi:capsular polysaccharide transport system permease protein
MIEDASKKAEPAGEAPARAEAPPGAGAAVPALPAKRRRGAKPAETSPAEAERAKVIHIVRRLQEEASQSRRRKTPWLLVSAVAGILLPTLVAAFYYFAIAADRYVSEARFAVRSNEAQMADALGMLTGLPASTVVSDSYIVSDYIKSREMVAELERRLPLRAIYSDPRADFLYRLDADAKREALVAYWERRLDVFYDSTKNTIAVQVEAFRPEHAQRLTGEIVAVVRELVNSLSSQARNDAVQFASSELARAELRVRAARQAMLDFRVAHNDFDPTATAAATLGIVAQLEGERSKLNAQLASVAGYLAAEAPQMQVLKAKLAAIEGEIARVQGQISHGDAPTPAGLAAGDLNDPALASLVGDYQGVLLDQEFAEKSYAAAQASLERARADADRTQSYLAIYMNPALADEAALPRRPLAVLVVFVFACVIWAVGALIALTVKDHMP